MSTDLKSNRAVKSGFAHEANEKVQSKYDVEQAQEALQWISDLTGENFDTSGQKDNFYQQLKDGNKLCQNMAKVEISETDRGKPALQFEGYRTPHSHGPDPEKFAVEKVVVDMKKRCEHQLPYAAFQASSQVVTDPQMTVAIPSFESLRSTLYRYKGNKNEPPTPTSWRNLCIPDKYGKLRIGENFLQVQSSGYVVLGTEHGLRFLFNATEVHVDGNFKVAPTSQAGGTPSYRIILIFRSIL
ncbi:unnamed protein product [Didymodactylos carnosus]|uniref:Uncharacterized protein n=1 Tax=Didymodactylos carnosus TaxID=1234261 RepID=A0A813QRD2_9BILA|nr:unnamed protein product [Didymodactylos carnosus]CAF3552223.1 unnamed protein product [Didymodactylos carnosus]